MTDLADFSAADLLDAYRTRRASPIEATDAVIRRIERCEAKLNAMYAFDPDAARIAARESERRWTSGGARGLEGVPTTIKENIATRGTPIPLGTAARDLVPLSLIHI